MRAEVVDFDLFGDEVVEVLLHDFLRVDVYDAAGDHVLLGLAYLEFFIEQIHKCEGTVELVQRHASIRCGLVDGSPGIGDTFSLC